MKRIIIIKTCVNHFAIKNPIKKTKNNKNKIIKLQCKIILVLNIKKE